jgi:hypothetical protein
LRLILPTVLIHDPAYSCSSTGAPVPLHPALRTVPDVDFPLPPLDENLRPDDIYCVFHSSGSTSGVPKGTLSQRSHRSPSAELPISHSRPSLLGRVQRSEGRIRLPRWGQRSARRHNMAVRRLPVASQAHVLTASVGAASRTLRKHSCSAALCRTGCAPSSPQARTSARPSC